MEAAEILAIRNLVHAERGKKSSLTKKIPAGEKESLQAQVRKLTEKESFQTLAQSAEIKDAVTDGHGGLMIDRMREKAQDPTFTQDGAVKEILNANTYGGRMKEIRKKAEVLKENLNAVKEFINNPVKEQYLDQAKQLAGEYMALTYSAGATLKDSEGKNIPWRDVNKQAGKLIGSPHLSLLFSDADEAIKQLKTLSEKDPLTFVEGTQKLPAPKVPGKENAPENEKGFEKGPNITEL